MLVCHGYGSLRPVLQVVHVVSCKQGPLLVFCLSLAPGSDVPKSPPASAVPASGSTSHSACKSSICKAWIWHTVYKLADMPYRTHDVPKGYSHKNPPPILGYRHEENFCPCCLICPCIVLKPPDSLRGCSDAHIWNRPHRYRLYKAFWKLLKDLCLWSDDRYLERKRRVTQEHDKREIISSCVVKVGVLYDNNACT